MIRYILKRILQVIPVLIGITVIVFTLMYFNPSDPALAILGENATPEQVEEIRQELGLDDPYIVQLGRYILNAAKGDFGTSYRTGNPVLKEVLTRYPYTLLLSVLSTFLGVIIGVVAGIVSSVKQYSIVDNIFSAFSLLGISAPSFWIAMIGATAQKRISTERQNNLRKEKCILPVASKSNPVATAEKKTIKEPAGSFSSSSQSLSGG